VQVGNLPTESVDDIQRFHFVMQPTVRKGAASEEKLKVYKWSARVVHMQNQNQ